MGIRNLCQIRLGIRMVSGLKTNEYIERLDANGHGHGPQNNQQKRWAGSVVWHGSRWCESDSQHENPHNLRMPQVRMEIRRNFYIVRVVDNWNKIPDRVKAVAKSEKFQQQYKQLRATGWAGLKLIVRAKTTGAELIPEKDDSWEALPGPLETTHQVNK